MPSENRTKNLELNQWQGNEYLKREDLNEDNKKIDDAFGEVNEKIKANADNITNLQNKKNIIIKEITLASSNWKVDNTFGYYMDINDTNIQLTDVVDINFSLSYIASNNPFGIYNITTALIRAVRIYAKEKPTINLLATMIIQKGV